MLIILDGDIKRGISRAIQLGKVCRNIKIKQLWYIGVDTNA